MRLLFPRKRGRILLEACFFVATLLFGFAASAQSSVHLIYPSSSETVSTTTPPVIFQQGTVGSSTIYDGGVRADVIVEGGGWLSGWDNRIKLSIDSNDIDDDLSNFPILLYLSTSSGRGSDDVSFIFDELQSDANRKKIAFTTSDKTTQCYVEIEKWDDTNEQAWIWVKVPSINSSVDTELYLYYDSDHVDNTAYVGDTNSTPAENVWDSSFKLVTHMRDDPDTSHVRDSTENDNDGTKEDIGEPAVTTSGEISEAQYFDGSDDYVNCGSDTSLNIINEITLETWINMDQDPEDFYEIISKDKYSLYLYESASKVHLSAYFKINGKTVDLDFTTTDINPNEWTRLVITFNGTNIKGYVNDQINGTYNNPGTIDDSSSKNLAIGAWSDPENKHFDGKIDEVRISNTARSLAWIKASYESERDHLLDFVLEEDPVTFDHVLKVLNQVGVNWQINLQCYNDANLSRISSMTIRFHDGTSSDQIIVSDGTLTQSEGATYDLAGSATIFISIENLETSESGTTHMYIKLRILKPSTGLYLLYTIDFEVT